MATISLNVLPSDRPILGEFGKAIEGSKSVNFGISGGEHCDISCRHHPYSTSHNATYACYAARLEDRPDRIELRKKLWRHQEADPTEVCKRALKELKALVSKGQTPPWFRVSTNGSVPQPKNATKRFLKAFNELLEFCESNNIPVHLPVETAEKATFYRKSIGWRATVRESAQSVERFLSGRGAMSMVVGEKGMNQKERVELAKTMAKMRTARTGRKTVVCPAISARYIYGNKASSKAKCGNCTTCARPEVDVLFPIH